MDNLINFISNKLPLDTNTAKKLRSVCVETTYNKGDFLQKTGGYCKYFFFINNGLVKLSFDTGDGEFIMRFFQENVLFTELESLTTGTPSKYQIIALEDINAIKIPFTAFENLCKEDVKFGMFYSKFLTIAHINMMNRISEMLESDAKVRYSNFITQNPDMIHRISLGDLSKYLGINQVTLSRIRSKI